MRVALDKKRLKHRDIAGRDGAHRSEVEDLQLTVYTQLTVPTCMYMHNNNRYCHSEVGSILMQA